MGYGAVVDGPVLKGMFEAVFKLAGHHRSAEREPCEEAKDFLDGSPDRKVVLEDLMSPSQCRSGAHTREAD